MLCWMKEGHLCSLEELTWLHISNPARFYHYLYKKRINWKRFFYGKWHSCNEGIPICVYSNRLNATEDKGVILKHRYEEVLLISSQYFWLLPLFKPCCSFLHSYNTATAISLSLRRKVVKFIKNHRNSALWNDIKVSVRGSRVRRKCPSQHCSTLLQGWQRGQKKTKRTFRCDISVEQTWSKVCVMLRKTLAIVWFSLCLSSSLS